MYEITKAKVSDAEEIAEIYCSLIGEPGCTWDGHYPTLEHVRADIAASSLYKVTENGIIIASAYLGEYEEISRPDFLDGTVKNLGELGRVGVRREYHRKGIASALLEFLKTEAQNRGYDGIVLLVGTENNAAAALYEKSGFRRLGEAYLYETHWYFYYIELKE